jgi:hypothetical protein
MNELKVITDNEFQINAELKDVGMNNVQMGEGFNFITGRTTATSAIKNVTQVECENSDRGCIFDSKLIASISDVEEIIDLAMGGTFVSKDTRAEGSVEFLSHVEYSSTSITLVNSIICSGELQRIKNPELTEKAKNLIIEDPEKFRSTYGDYFISGGLESKKMNLVYTFRSESMENIKDLKIKLEGKKAEDLVNISGEIEKMSNSQKIEIEIHLSIVGELVGPISPPTDFEAAAQLAINFQDDELFKKVLTDYELTAYFTLNSKYPDTIEGDFDNLLDIMTLNKATYLNAVLIKNIPGDKLPASYPDYEKKVETLQHLKDLATNSVKLKEIKEAFELFTEQLNPIIKRKAIYDRIIEDRNNEYHGERNHGSKDKIWSEGIVKGLEDIITEHCTAKIDCGITCFTSDTKDIVVPSNIDRIYCGWTVQQKTDTKGQWWIEGVIGKDFAKMHFSNDHDDMVYEIYYCYLQSKDYDFSK